MDSHFRFTHGGMCQQRDSVQITAYIDTGDRRLQMFIYFDASALRPFQIQISNPKPFVTGRRPTLINNLSAVTVPVPSAFSYDTVIPVSSLDTPTTFVLSRNLIPFWHIQPGAWPTALYPCHPGSHPTFRQLSPVLPNW